MNRRRNVYKKKMKEEEVREMEDGEKKTNVKKVALPNKAHK